jgi:hypothetical protein
MLALSLPGFSGCQKVTQKQCNQVKKGMDIDQVAKMLGGRGEEKPTGSTAGPDVTYRTWQNPDGTSCDVLFRKGKVFKTMWTK